MTAKTLLKPESAKSKKTLLKQQELIKEAEERRTAGKPPIPGEAVWILHYPISATKPEWVNLKNGEKTSSEPALYKDQSADLANLDASALSFDKGVYSILGKRKAYTFFRQETVLEASEKRERRVDDAEILARYNSLPPSAKAKYERLELQDEKRYMLERQLYNDTKLTAVFQKGDKVAANVEARVVLAVVPVAALNAYVVKTMDNVEYRGIPPNDLSLEGSEGLAKNWHNEVAVKDRLYVLQTPNAFEYRVGVVKEVKENGHVVVDVNGTRLETQLSGTLQYSKGKGKAKGRSYLRTNDKEDNGRVSLLGKKLKELRAMAQAEGLSESEWPDSKVPLRVYLEEHLTKKQKRGAER